MIPKYSGRVEGSPRDKPTYRDPRATSQLLRPLKARRKRRGRGILVAGLAVPLVALLFSGVETRVQPAGNEQIPPPAETADPMAGSGSADGGQPPVQPETAALPLEPAAGKLDLGGAVPLADEQDLTAAQRQINAALLCSAAANVNRFRPKAYLSCQ